MTVEPSTPRSTQAPGPVTVSVVMPAFNAAPFLARSLPPLIALAQSGLVLEVLVVDDGSTDDTAALAAHLGATVVAAADRAGPAAARNLAARRARGQVLWFVDADVVPHPGTAERLLEHFADPALSAVFGSYCDEPPEPGFFSQYKNLVHHYYHQRNGGLSRSFWSGCGAVRRQHFLAVGGFDAQLFPRPSIEDVEFGHRLHRAGLTTTLDPTLLCTHLKRWSLAQLVAVDVRARALPWCRLVLVGRAPDDELNMAAAERRSAVLAVGLLTTLVLAALPWVPAWVPALLCLFSLWSNWPLIRFFRAKRGRRFAVGAWLYQQVFYGYSSLTMACCWVERLFVRPVSEPPEPLPQSPEPQSGP